MTTATRHLGLPLWAKACMTLMGFLLLLPFVVPALSLMLLAAIPVIVGFIPWLAFQASSVRAGGSAGPQRLRSPRKAREPNHAPTYSRAAHA
jgi:hypothetical protein